MLYYDCVPEHAPDSFTLTTSVESGFLVDMLSGVEGGRLAHGVAGGENAGSRRCGDGVLGGTWELV